MAPVQGQVSVSVAREKHRAEVNLQSDSLYSTVHADVPLSYRTKQNKKPVFQFTPMQFQFKSN